MVINIVMAVLCMAVGFLMGLVVHDGIMEDRRAAEMEKRLRKLERRLEK